MSKKVLSVSYLFVLWVNEMARSGKYSCFSAYAFVNPVSQDLKTLPAISQLFYIKMLIKNKLKCDRIVYLDIIIQLLNILIALWSLQRMSLPRSNGNR